MPKLPFVYYIPTDSSKYSFHQWLEGELDIEIDEDLMLKIGYPFREVALSCTLDTDTGNIDLMAASLLR